MALNKEQLKQGIITLQQDMLTKTEPSIEEYAERLAPYCYTRQKWRGNGTSRNHPTGRSLYGSYYQCGNGNHKLKK